VALAFMLVLMAVYHVAPSPQILLLPIFVVGAMMVAAGAGVLFSALTVSYRDFRYVITFVVQLWLFATPVLYALEIVPARWRLLYGLNPMVGMIVGFRAAVLGGPLPLDLILTGFFAATVLLTIGLRYFTAVERRFADVI
jgi:lipopolysaccharide transport system permease protein